MSVSRRQFVSALGLGGTGLLAAPSLLARGREAAPWVSGSPFGTQDATLRLDSNENPNGPSRRALEALQGMLGEANRYPDDHEEALAQAIARAHGIPREHIVLGCGSSETLRQCVQAFTSPTAGLVTAAPSFELPVDVARLLGHPVTSVPVGAGLALDLEAMAARSTGAGLVFLCNPNNPTATVHDDAAVRGFIAQVHRTAPGATVLVTRRITSTSIIPGIARRSRSRSPTRAWWSRAPSPRCTGWRDSAPGTRSRIATPRGASRPSGSAPA